MLILYYILRFIVILFKNTVSCNACKDVID
nr:MAG TPA: hypothetical protein [Caudoviricetes sp.]